MLFAYSVKQRLPRGFAGLMYVRSFSFVCCLADGNHRENSPVTQTTPEPTLLTWGGWPREKYPPPPLQNPVLSHLSDHSDPIVLEPFDVTLWYSVVPQMPNLLKISSDIESDVSNGTAHWFKSWVEFLGLVLAKLFKNAFDAAAGSSDAWQLPTELAGGVKLCSGAWKHGQDSHTAVSSLWMLKNSAMSLDSQNGGCYKWIF